MGNQEERVLLILKEFFPIASLRRVSGSVAQLTVTYSSGSPPTALLQIHISPQEDCCASRPRAIACIPDAQFLLDRVGTEHCFSFIAVHKMTAVRAVQE